ncbi:PDC sensor domain-containing protein [candidate division KSB1 bacterium]|nr:PDC sensor domain-containing protein [candidate division KSB1 bacterium]
MRTLGLIIGVMIIMFLLPGCDQKSNFTPDKKESTVKIEGLSDEANLYIENELKKLQELANEAIIIQAIVQSNQDHQTLVQEEISKLDLEWRADNTADNPIIEKVINNECSKFLATYVTNFPQIMELFVMDNKGLLVATSRITSDYNQADEAKWSEVFGKNKNWYGKLEYDRSVNSHGVQISIPVKEIGAICATVSLKNRQMNL